MRSGKTARLAVVMAPATSGAAVPRVSFAACVALAALLASMNGGAQSGSPTRRYAPRVERAVQPGGIGPNRLALDQWAVTVGQPFRVMSVGTTTIDQDARAFIAAGGLADLRLYDAANREVPYLLVPPVQPIPNWIAGEILPLVETKTSSGFELALPQATAIDRVRIEGLPPRFLKRATLEGSGDRSHWTALAPQATVFDLPDDHLKQLVIAFPSGEYRYLRLTWDDRTSGRLPRPATVRVREALAVPAPEPLRVALEVEKRPSEPGRSRYRVVFPAARMPVTDLEVVARDANILRRARVTETQLAGDRLVPLELGAATLRRASRDVDNATAADLRVPMPAPSSTQVELTIEDGNNAPLDLTGVTAVLAPLPWIYFESPDGAPLVARLGDAKAAAPAYDLEAVRPNLAKLTTATAAWGVPSTPSASPSTAASSASGTAVEPQVPPAAGALSGASIDVSAFRFGRDVPASPAGLTALALDAAVLAHSDLTDLRLVDNDGHQHAYVLESRDEPLTLALGGPLAPGEAPDWLADQLKNAPSGNRTIYRLHLPYDTLPASKLVLTTGTRVFTRQVAALVKAEATNTRDRVGAHRLASATWAHAAADEPAPHLTFELPALTSGDLVLMVDEGDNAPLPIASATMLLPGSRIRFLREDAQPLTLYYGDETLSAPRYDLALLTPYLLDAPASEIAPGPEQERAPAVSAAHLPFWAFWAVLIVAVLILLALIVRLLRAESAETSGVP
jgi:hypothetical protein